MLILNTIKESKTKQGILSNCLKNKNCILKIARIDVDGGGAFNKQLVAVEISVTSKRAIS